MTAKRMRFADFNSDSADRAVKKYVHDEDHSAPFNDEFYNDPRFVRVDMDLVRRYIMLFKQDSDMQTFSRAAMDHVLSGGILLQRQGYTMDDNAKEWHSQRYSQWLRDVYVHDFCLGFAISTYTPHFLYGGEPKVISMDHVEIQCYVDCTNTAHFRVWEVIDPRFFGHSFAPFGRRRLKNIKVWSSSPPTRDGKIRSLLQTLMADLVYEKHLLEACLVADHARSQPLIVTQRKQEPYDSTKALSVIDKTNLVKASSMVTTFSRLGDGTNHTERGGNNNQYRNAVRIAEFMNTFHADSTEAIASRLDRMLRSHINNRALPQLYIEDGREIAKHVLPEAPHDIILGYMQKRMVKVALVFGFTLPALTSSAKANAAADVRKAGGKGKEDDGSNSVYFENTMRSLKCKLLTTMREMYMFIHFLPFMREKMSKYEREEAPPDFDMGVSISFPGQPNEAKLRELLLDSVLKPEWYINYVSSNLGIPREAFQLPKLTLRELNGIQEKEDSAGEQSTTTTTTKKSSNSSESTSGSKKAEETTTTTTKSIK